MQWFGAVLYLVIYLQSSSAEPRCRCLANNATCWPNATSWRSFNESVNGRLVLPKPSAAVCNGLLYDAAACADARAHWSNAVWRGDLAGAMQNHNWENSSCSVVTNSTKCNQGAVPVFGVDAILPEHVQATVQFAARNRLRLVVKATGHDYFGRSGATGSLLLWLHHMKNMTLIQQYSACGNKNLSKVARIGAGAQWGEVYQWLDGYNLTAIGGASGTVGAVGGYLQGGGHSPLSRWKGMAADQVLEYDVVKANGERQTVSPCQNSDLYWALSGGGGGTYAVVLSAVLRTFSTPYMVVTTFGIAAPSENRYSKLIASFVQWLPLLADAGWSSYFTIKDVSLTGVLHWPNGNYTAASITINQFAANNSDLDFSGSKLFVLPSFYSYFAIVLEPNNPTGANVLLGSRLIPESIVRSDPNRVAQVFVQAKGVSMMGSSLLGHLVAGGQVSNASNYNNSVNPGWRKALLHMVYAQGWLDTTSAADQNYLAQEVTRHAQLLNQITTPDSPTCYWNEADPSESNWQDKFFGNRANYNTLKSVKQSVDPDGLFVCKNCVGSDDWSADFNCPKVSSSTSIDLKLSLLLIQISAYFL